MRCCSGGQHPAGQHRLCHLPGAQHGRGGVVGTPLSGEAYVTGRYAFALPPCQCTATGAWHRHVQHANNDAFVMASMPPASLLYSTFLEVQRRTRERTSW